MRPFLALVLVAGALAACDVNPFDRTQVPDLSVTTTTPAPVFAWTPAGAHYLRVYEGTTSRGGLAPIVWDVLRASAGKNTLTGPITYGVVPASGMQNVPAKALVSGQPYLVEVYRDDPKGTGDGFTNTANAYRDTAVFVAP